MPCQNSQETPNNKHNQNSRKRNPDISCRVSLHFRLLNPHIGQNAHHVDNLRVPTPLLGSTEHQECVSIVGVEAHEDVPQGVPLRVYGPSRHLFAEDPVQETTEAAKDESQQVELREPLGCIIIRVDVVLVHSGDTEEAESRIVKLEAKSKAEE